MFPGTFFDYNGVLANDETLHWAAFVEVLSPLGLHVSEQDYWDRYLGFDDAGAFRQILIDAGRSPLASEIQALIAAKRPVYLRKVAAGLPTFPGASALVHTRADAGPVAVVSGALREEIELGLTALGVRDRVCQIIAAEDVSESKPSPECYHRAIEALRPVLGEAVQRSLVIEDSLAGVQAAKAAGLCCLAVAHSYPAFELTGAGADAVYPALADVTEARLAELYRKLYA